MIILMIQAERGFAAAAFCLFSLGGGYGRFLAENEFNAPWATDLLEEINPPQAEQY